MKPLVLIGLIIISFVIKTNAQTKDTTDVYEKMAKVFRYDRYKYTLTTNKSWAKNEKTLTFENQGKYNSTYLAINDDSTFDFVSIYEPGEFLTTGTWTKSNNRAYHFTWDQQKTFAYCKDSNIYKKFYQHYYPTPLKVNNWTFTKKGNLLKPKAKR